MNESDIARSSRSLATHTFRLLLSPDSFELVTGITRGLPIEMFSHTRLDTWVGLTLIWLLYYLPNSALAGGKRADSAEHACRIVEQPNQSQPNPCVNRMNNPVQS